MDKKIEEVLIDLSKLLEEQKTNCLFSDVLFSLESVDELCKKYLILRGYRTIKRASIKTVNNVDTLINYYYDLYNYYRAENCFLSSNPGKDKKIISNFIKQRQTLLNCHKEEAIKDIAHIIEAMFIYEKELNLEQPLGIWIFGTDKCKWITDKLIQLTNSKKNDQALSKALFNARSWSQKASDEYAGFNFEEL